MLYGIFGRNSVPASWIFASVAVGMSEKWSNVDIGNGSAAHVTVNYSSGAGIPTRKRVLQRWPQYRLADWSSD
jgi:hypothetical protein